MHTVVGSASHSRMLKFS